ncbi:MAG: REP-associated tyrosine transposase [Terrimicrobiaceae bacterium]
MTKHFPPDSGRKHPAHFPTVEAFNRSTAIFVTVCTEKRNPLLARPQIHELLRAIWHEINDWLVGDYILMPDHLHFLCVPASHESPALARWIKYWKSVASRRWPFPDEQPVWQNDFWDTQLRDREHHSAKWDYIRNNPVRHKLCAEAEDWKFQGQIHDLAWHD